MIRSMERRDEKYCMHGQTCAGDAAARKQRGRPKRRHLDVVRKDVQEVGAREDEVFDRSVSWRILCRPLVGKPERCVRAYMPGPHAWFNTMCTTYACTVCPHE